MNSLFISYAREDGVLARQLFHNLKTPEREIWADWEDIPPGAEWRQKIDAGIEDTNAFVVVLSPDWLASVPCAQEFAHALQNNKRLIPIVARDVDAARVPRELERKNWIFMRPQDEFQAGMRKVVECLETDLEWVDFHTRLQVKALEWKKSGSPSALLRGEKLKEAEVWLKEAFGKKPAPSQDHLEYVHQSRLQESKRGRMLWSSIGVGVLVVALLGILAINYAIYAEQQNRLRETAQANSATQAAIAKTETSGRVTQEAVAKTEAAGRVVQQTFAISRRLASLAQAEGYHSTALLLAIEAYEQYPTSEAGQALIALLQKEPNLAAPLQGGYQQILNQVFSPDETKLAVVGCHDFKMSRGCFGTVIQVFDVQSARSLTSLAADTPQSEGMLYLAFSPDGKALAVGFPQEATLFDVASGARLDRVDFPDLAQNVNNLGLNPGQTGFLPGKPEATALEWQAPTLTDRLLISPQGDLGADPVNQVLYDLTTRSLLGQPLKARQGPYLGLGFNNGRLLGLLGQMGDHSASDFGSQAEIRPPAQPGGSLAASSPDLQFAAFGDASGALSIWPLSGGELIQVHAPKEWREGDQSQIGRIAIASSGQSLAVGYSGNHPSQPYVIPYGVKILEVPSGKVVGEFLQAPDLPAFSWQEFTDLQFTPSGLLVATFSDGVFDILDPRTEVLRGWGTIPGARVVTINPGDSWLAVGRADGSIQILDALTVSPIGDLKGYSSPVVSLTFTPDGQMLLSGHEDGSVILWDLRYASLKERACRQANRDFSAEEWQKYLPGLPYRKTCTEQTFHLLDFPGAPSELELLERAIQRLPDSSLPEKLRNILPDNPPVPG